MNQNGKIGDIVQFEDYQSGTGQGKVVEAYGKRLKVELLNGKTVIIRRDSVKHIQTHSQK